MKKNLPRTTKKKAQKQTKNTEPEIIRAKSGNPLNVLYVTPDFAPEDNACSVRAQSIVESLRKAGALVHVLTTTRGAVSKDVTSTWFKPADNKSGNLKRLIFEVITGKEMFFRILFMKVDRIIITTPPFFMGSIAVWAAWMKRVPLVLDVRDPYPEVFFGLGIFSEQGLAGKVLRRVALFNYRKAEKITTVTEGFRKMIEGYVPSEKVEILANGFNEGLFAPSTAKFKKFTLVVHGNLGKLQDVDLILEVARRLEKQVEVMVIGTGSGEEKIRAAALPNLKHIPHVSHAEIGKLVAQAHVGLSFRKGDPVSLSSFPVKVYEYMGCSLPVVIAPRCSAGEFAEKNKIGRQYDSSSVDDICDYLLKLQKDRALYAKAVSAVKKISPGFSRQKQAAVMLRILNS